MSLGLRAESISETRADNTAGMMFPFSDSSPASMSIRKTLDRSLATVDFKSSHLVVPKRLVP